MWLISLLLVHSLFKISEGASNYTFPTNFLFGLASSSYQIEGAWNKDGKGMNIWDTMTHQYPEYIKDGSTGDIAADSYHLYKEDVKLLKQVGVDFYRFSISWVRILPNGIANEINQAGINYYNNLINELLINGIEPFVTIFHWDLPQQLQDIGGLVNREIVDHIVTFADVLFKNFGDRVKWWLTFNEPSIAALAYESDIPTFTVPGASNKGLGYYLASHHTLLAHSKIYHLYEKQYKPHQKGKISIAVNGIWCEPYSSSLEDEAAAKRVMEFTLGLYAHPIFTNEGDYSSLIKERVANNSAAEGFLDSRLPRFTQQEIQLLRGSADFFSLNHYITYLIKDAESEIIDPSFIKDLGADLIQDPQWESSTLQQNKVVPWGFRKLLVWVSRHYNNPTIFLTENGYADHGQLNDIGRINYITKYMMEILNAMYEESVNIIGYTLWSLMDNFEWFNGYTQKFGIFHVDYNDTARKRTKKNSAKVFAEIIKTRTIPSRYR